MSRIGVSSYTDFICPLSHYHHAKQAVRHLLCHLLVCALATIWFAVRAQAQITGLPPFGTITGGPDAIDLSNLNVHYSIPVFNKVGRGLPFSYSLSVDNSIWTKALNSANQTYSWAPSSGFGVASGASATFGAIYYTTFVKVCAVLGREINVTAYQTWFTDASQTPHGGSTIYQANQCGLPTSFTGLASDGSGITLNIVSSPLSGTITMPNGDIIVPPVIDASGSLHNGPVYTWTDRNGNRITLNSQGTTNYVSSIVDTFGGTVLTSTGAIPSPVKYTYTAPSNAPASVTVSYKGYTVQTAIGCSGVNEYPATAQNLVDRITLPDSSYYHLHMKAQRRGAPTSLDASSP